MSTQGRGPSPGSGPLSGSGSGSRSRSRQGRVSCQGLSCMPCRNPILAKPRLQWPASARGMTISRGALARTCDEGTLCDLVQSCLQLVRGASC